MKLLDGIHLATGPGRRLAWSVLALVLVLAVACGPGAAPEPDAPTAPSAPSVSGQATTGKRRGSFPARHRTCRRRRSAGGGTHGS